MCSLRKVRRIYLCSVCLLFKDNYGMWQQYGEHEKGLEELLQDSPNSSAEFRVEHWNYTISVKGELFECF